ncbi:UDP-N-acetylmuramoyl-L-alanyl-D-glutamate--2,6-diaminopimelate ligase [Acetobacter sacchari]|uniref:UDP-N-acetylmuramoyl-L-alanyl-D-glutamate--2,6-diaminopimelate ligase n=1 Tax=Acetobacter sacchari TaxID=2661687 RepID=A0ABS3LVD6_9PROT|nr:UDP-N-acetylmuramoyl-L-alanyl-D-glutamate--2,6-diaminopimelate ligase [Acetobacter sacchari]MBO1359871.1 UDP-N-acetylmuramoyl-L-alanyl-D-glutamate--2,6-diaminopimelate ligase [Acetobacter sacchari]
MRLSALLTSIGLPFSAAHDPEITAITADSREAAPGVLFAALPGVKTDGRRFIPSVIAAGTSAILAPTDTPDIEQANVALVKCADARRALSLLAAAFAGPQPDHQVAVTGTNGKTSTVDFLRQLWTATGRSAASLGTLGLKAPFTLPFEIPSLTTPDPVTLARGLAALRAEGVTDVAMEASSHGLDQRRLDGVQLSAAGFTNLTRDHLDYHGDLAAYRAAKLRLFDTLLPEGAIAAANADMDSKTLGAIRDIAKQRRLTLRLVGENGDTLRLMKQESLPEGQRLLISAFGRDHDIVLSLPGRFQADNILLAIALAARDEAGVENALTHAQQLRGVRGRMERAALLDNGAAVYVDYAHTPDALARALTSLRPHARGRLLVAFGAGGDRDRGKRPLMAREAAANADVVIITDDNPRSENPADIRHDVLAGAPGALEIGDRAKAIAAGLDMLQPGDVLLVAGKGHEQGQTIGGVVHPFDDVGVVRELAGAA